jgi:type IV pilus assembly protein PilM
MASARFAWGIDIGNRALKAIKLVHGDAGLRVDDFEVIEHENVLSNAGDNKEALIRASLQNFVQRHPITGGVAGVGVSGVSSFARFIKLPPVETKRIPEIVKFEAIQQIPFPLDDVEWSYQLFQTPDNPDVEVGIFAMRRELINQHMQYFTEVDLNVQVVQMNPLAVYNAMYHDNRINGTTMLVDLGAENTDLIIADGETVWLRSIPIGGNNFTEVLVKSFKLPFGKAEELKRNANTSKYARQIFQAMRPVFADLVAEIQRSIGFYSSVHRDSRIKKIVALGGTFRLAGLQKYLQQNLQLEVEKLNEFSAGAPADTKLATTFSQNLLSMVSAYGLAIQAMNQAKITSNLLPQHIRREKMWRDKTKWFGAAAAMFVLGAGMGIASFYMQNYSYAAAAPTRAKDDALITQAASLSQAWTTQVENGGGGARQQITNIRQLLDNRGTWVTMLPDLLGTAGFQSDPKSTMAKPRDQREIVLVDKVTNVYSQYPDLIKAWQTNAAPGAPAPTDADIPPNSRGFVFTMNITTPHADGYLYILKNYVPKLAKLNSAWLTDYNTRNPKTPKNYYIAQVFSPKAQSQLKFDQARMGLMQASYGAAIAVTGKTPTPIYAPVPPGTTPPRNPVDISPYLDRNTGEDMRNDWEMQVTFIVVLIDVQPK